MIILGNYASTAERGSEFVGSIHTVPVIPLLYSNPGINYAFTQFIYASSYEPSLLNNVTAKLKSIKTINVSLVLNSKAIAQHVEVLPFT